MSSGTASRLLVRSTVMFTKWYLFEWVAVLLDIREVLGSYFGRQKAFLEGSCGFSEFSQIMEFYFSSPYCLICILRSSFHFIVLPPDSVVVSDMFIEMLSNLRVNHRMLLLWFFCSILEKNKVRYTSDILDCGRIHV